MKSKTNRFSFIYFFLTTFTISLFAQESVLTEIKSLYPEEIKYAGFILEDQQQLKIEALALQPYRRHNGFPFSYAWILDAKTRNRVWELEDASDINQDGTRVTFAAQITLKPGTYEVYYSTYPHFDNNYYGGIFHHKDGRGFFSYLFDEIFDGDDDHYDRRYYYNDEYDDLFIRIMGKGKSLSMDNVIEKQKVVKDDAFISFTALRDEEIQEIIFKVTEPVDIHIYSIGEANRDGEFDFGWIMDLEKRRKVWQLEYRDSDHAGGAFKNRLFNDVVTLPKGTYKAVYGTDDSHSYKRWNSSPPYDPEFWGLTIWLKDPSQKSFIKELDSEQGEVEHTIVDLTKVRNHDYRSKGFTLKKPMDIHIFALGEGTNDEMVDYGWIVDTKTRKKVWVMDYYDTDPAGGASKNRLYDGVVHLDPGNYMVYYITDGSHAYHSWNSSAPFYETKWGITVTVLNDGFNPKDIAEYEESEDKSILVKLTGIGDYEKQREKFTLDKDSEVHIYALGEGMSGEMYDYAWIEDANTGRTVWEMTYRKTTKAGGARKNRLFDDTVHLKAGEYYVIYRSDDSHSFGDWNNSPPHDPVNWGITLSLVD